MEVDNPGFYKIDPVIDIFGTQAFMPPYKETQTHNKKSYWCYPNHNTYERKDPVIMCKGGRMTYGFGYWRSGFDLLVPWIWRNNSPKHFYREKGSGGANIFHPETGEMIMLASWENFREGINDLNYVYTLEDAVIKRENSKDPTVKKLIVQARDLLQNIWDSIDVQEKYLNFDLWPSDQFDARRAQLGRMILALYQYPETNSKTAPSVIIDSNDRAKKSSSPLSIYREQLANNNISVTPIFSVKDKNKGWGKTETEASVSLENIKGAGSPETVCLKLDVDQIHDGTGNKQGSYPSGWPGMVYDFKDGSKLSDYDLVYIRYRLDSNREPAADQLVNGPISWLIRVSGNKGKTNSIAVELPKKVHEGEWIEVAGMFDGKLYDGLGAAYGKLNHIRASIAESQYRDGDVLTFSFDRMEFIKLKKPIFSKTDLPKAAQALYKRVRFAVTVLGTIEKGDRIQAELIDPADQKTIGKKTGADTILGVWTGIVPEEKTVKGQINLKNEPKPGFYAVRFRIIDEKNSVKCEKISEIELVR